jgi:MarR family 2-MHQ and catechol resistance regulon transcriptional repressor
MPTHYQGNKKDGAALNAYINLVRAAETVLSRLGTDLAARGLTLGQFGVLEALLHLGPLCQTELSAKLLRTGGNVTFVIDKLERRGWVRRERVANDRRKILVRLRPSGKQLIEQAFPQHLKAIVKEFGRLELGEQQTLRQLCRKLGRGDSRKIAAEEFEAMAKTREERNHDSGSTE